MTRLLLLSLFIGHLLGDYYFQSPEFALQKNTDWRSWVRHSLIYGTCLLPGLIVFPGPSFLLGVLGMTVLHAAIDRLKPQLEQRFARRGYIMDQLLHLATIALVTGILQDRVEPAHWIPENRLREVVSMLAMVLFCAKPANLTIKHLLATFSPTDKFDETDESLLHGGQVIGTLERFMVYLLLLVNQWGGVGVVFAAKSIVRWKNISKDTTEYFLIGTLLSLIFVVAGFYLIYIY